jgi:hypothetical protein
MTDNFNKSVTVVIPNAADINNTLTIKGTAENYTMSWAPASVQHGNSVL